ncbi:MAG: transposase [Rubrobacteraceae bacterium]|nr:transposase [Rubrobacteraceae bacterium]
MAGVHAEVFLAAGYAAFLLCAATGIDLLARYSHARSVRYRTAGFTYHHAHDAWICPEDQILTRSETDHERRLVRYRGRSQICNHCPAKDDCTDSEDGREVVRAMDPWPHSEAGRFHRGISLVVALIAGLILSAETLRNHAPLELAVLGAALVVVALMLWHLHAAFRTTPANFPIFRPTPLSPIPKEGPRTGYRKRKEVRR